MEVKYVVFPLCVSPIPWKGSGDWTLHGPGEPPMCPRISTCVDVFFFLGRFDSRIDLIHSYLPIFCSTSATVLVY